MDSFNPISIISQAPVDQQQLILLHQVQNHILTPLQLALLGYLLSFQPITWFLPLQTRLNIYYFLAPFIGWLPIPPWLATTIILLWPIFLIIFLVCCFYLFKLLLGLFRFILLRLLKRFMPDKFTGEEKIFLEVTFPSDTSKSAYATEQLYRLLHTLGRRNRGSIIQRFINGQKKTFSLEIISTKDAGIRYIIVSSVKDAPILQANLLSFLPGVKIKETKEYLPEIPQDLDRDYRYGVLDVKLHAPFALPLSKQTALKEHDPISYLAGSMAKPHVGELIAFQVIVTPLLDGVHGKAVSIMNTLRQRIYKGLPLAPVLNKSPLDKFLSFPVVNIIWFFVKFGLLFLQHLIFLIVDIMFNAASNNKSQTISLSSESLKTLQQQKEMQNPYEQELRAILKEKIDQHLFETTIRVLVVAQDDIEYQRRVDGFFSAFGTFSSPYQSLSFKHPWIRYKSNLKRFEQFRNRMLSPNVFSDNPILSTAEIADMYHFPYTDITKTEGLVKSRSRELPAPLSLKKSTTNFDVLIGMNQYGGELMPIGITLEQRQKHMYVIGKTGTGKTTLLTSAIYQDMLSGKGLAVFDPHGDMFQELLTIIPESRKKDVIVFDPSDRDYPIGLNLLSPGIKFSNKEDEHDWIASSVLAVFKKLADEQYWGPRMEHVLRNTTLTALLTPKPNLYTLQRLLTDKKYQKEVALTLKDPVLKQFWQKEFALMGNMQLSAVTAPLTQRLGYFISSKMSRHILLQEHSTFSIQKIMDEGKILLINLSKGDLGEDQSFFFGTIITSLIWMAAYQRTKIPESQRRDFFVYIDEFQNFATPQFADITSEGRKFHVSLITSHQNIAQIKDKDTLKEVAGNAHIIICTKASPDDEAFILPFMDPEVEKGDIVNLAPFNFFMKVTTDESEDAFSGRTVPIDVESSENTKNKIIAYTRKQYATPRSKVEEYLETLFAEKPKKKSKAKKTKPNTTSREPSKKERKTAKKIAKKGI